MDSLLARNVTASRSTGGAPERIEGLTLGFEPATLNLLFGPPESGRNLLLRLLGLLERPEAGEVFVTGASTQGWSADQCADLRNRHFGFVFETPLLLPAFNVAENIAMPFFKSTEATPEEAREATRRVLAHVGLAEEAGTPVEALTLEAQQRVALARALVFEPALLLLDEPLSALDKKLRAELQEELKALHRRIGRTFINVTHDQEEALSLSDHIAILNHGKLVQLGDPAALYERPRTRFVADFLGKSNFLQGIARGPDAAGMLLEAGAARLHVRFTDPVVIPVPDAPSLLSLRPEKLRVLAEGEGEENEVTGRIRAWSYLGAGFSLVVATEHLGDLRVIQPAWKSAIAPAEGLPVRLGWPADAAVPVVEDAP